MDATFDNMSLQQHRVAFLLTPDQDKALQQASSRPDANVWLWGPPMTGKSFVAQDLVPKYTLVSHDVKPDNASPRPVVITSNQAPPEGIRESDKWIVLHMTDVVPTDWGPIRPMRFTRVF